MVLTETLTYRLEQFEGPLDLLLALIHKNKMRIEEISIALICDQYIEYLEAAESMDMELTGEFIVMASELMVLKSRALLPRLNSDEPGPVENLAEILRRHEQMKQAAVKMAELFRKYGGRMAKDTDEITVDTSYVADQEVTDLCLAVRRIIAANENRPRVEKAVFAPMIARPIIPVDTKIVGILHRMERKKSTTMKELLADATSLPDLIAIFLGILELMKVRKIRIDRDELDDDSIHGSDTLFSISDEPPKPENAEKKPAIADDEPIPLSSKAEMHREQRRIIREQKLAEKKRLRAEERARRAAERKANAAASDGQLFLADGADDDSDLDAEAAVEAMLDEQLSDREEDLLDDLGLDMNEIVSHMAKQAMTFPGEDKPGKPG